MVFNGQGIYKKALRLMGNRFEISVVDSDPKRAHANIDAAVAEISRIERLLTTFDDNSQTNRVNKYAGIKPVKVDKEVFDLMARAVKISKLTQGAFDITYGSIDKSLWNFDLNMTQLPDSETAIKAVRLINYKNIVLDEVNTTIFLKEEGMRIGFGGIGKGYAAEQAKAILINRGVKSGIVNASGDLNTWGTQPNGEKWTVGIANPDASTEIFSFLKISDMAIATSGNYEKYVIIGGKRYSHTIDPHTGYPVSGIKSVTIITINAELADAMTTPIMIMGINTGLDLINQMNDIEAIIIDDNNQVYRSKNLHFK